MRTKIIAVAYAIIFLFTPILIGCGGKLSHDKATKSYEKRRQWYKAPPWSVAQAYLRMGDYWRINLKNYPAAIETYKRLIEEISSGYLWVDYKTELIYAGDAQFKIGFIYQEMGEFDKAIEAYQTLLARWPESFRKNEAVYNMALCYEKVQDYENAYAHYWAYLGFGEKEEFHKEVKQKIKQYEYDEDGDGFPYWKEQQAGTSDQDKNSYPGMKTSKSRRKIKGN